ncbi:hypothetical protein IT575_00575 [bacterium]|nr:hypothetical protein [bacterium]
MKFRQASAGVWVRRGALAIFVALLLFAKASKVSLHLLSNGTHLVAPLGLSQILNVAAAMFFTAVGWLILVVIPLALDSEQNVGLTRSLAAVVVAGSALGILLVVWPRQGEDVITSISEIGLWLDAIAMALGTWLFIELNALQGGNPPEQAATSSV